MLCLAGPQAGQVARVYFIQASRGFVQAGHGHLTQATRRFVRAGHIPKHPAGPRGPPHQMRLVVDALLQPSSTNVKS